MTRRDSSGGAANRLQENGTAHAFGEAFNEALALRAAVPVFPCLQCRAAVAAALARHGSVGCLPRR